jgi:hypothetical protein
MEERSLLGGRRLFVFFGSSRAGSWLAMESVWSTMVAYIHISFGCAVVVGGAVVVRWVGDVGSHV